MKKKHLLLAIIIFAIAISCKSTIVDKEKDVNDMYDTFNSYNNIFIMIKYQSYISDRTLFIYYVDTTGMDYEIYNEVTNNDPQLFGYTTYFKINTTQYYDYIDKIKELSCNCRIDTTDINFDCSIRNKGKDEDYIISKNNIVSCINYHNNLTKDTMNVTQLTEYIRKYYNPKYEF